MGLSNLPEFPGPGFLSPMKLGAKITCKYIRKKKKPDLYLKGSVKSFIMCYHKTKIQKGKMPVSAKGGGELAFILEERKKSYASKLLLWQMPDATRPIFKSWGGGSKGTEKSKYVYDIFSSFWHINEDFFLRERDRKVSNSCRKNKEWSHKEVKLTISTFKLPLNKKTLMRWIYFNPLAEDMSKNSLSQASTGIKKVPVPFGYIKAKPSLAAWKLKPEITFLAQEIGLFTPQ